MNEAVLVLGVLIGVILGGLFWWLTSSIPIAVMVMAVVVGFVALMLPTPITPGETQPEQTASEASRPPGRQNVPLLNQLAAYRPIEFPDRGYTGSDACLECHPGNHASWFASYHRTMTQVARPDVVLGNFHDVKLSENGKQYRLTEFDDVCWVQMMDPAAIPGTFEARQLVQRPIVLTTGSHHMQAYWFSLGVGRTLGILPFVFLNETKEWIPRSAAFLNPVENEVSHEIGRWNAACSQCHATQRQERQLSYGDWDTRTVEFGISCEACHGPGQTHIAYHRDATGNKIPVDRSSEDPIVNPENLSHVRSSQICGQCHSVLTLKGDVNRINLEGSTFRPGNDLRDSHDIWQLQSPEMEQLLNNESLHDRVEYTNRGTFYPDGALRVAGREYTSMEQSACFQRGEMSCLTCHQLHKLPDDTRSDEEWANDQLKLTSHANDACTDCHAKDKYSTIHTHHLPNSSGSKCYNCHMPHTAYGLLKAIRNHTISSPDLKLDIAADRPNACNQCHLDKTLLWTAKHLDDWYSIEPPKLNEDQSEIAASVLWLLQGNAANRAITAWTMSWSEAQAASGNEWQSIFLARALDDPYLAIRLIARRSLRTLPGLVDLKINALGSESERQGVIESILNRWKPTITNPQPALLLEPDTGVLVKRVEQLMNQRDNSPMSLAE